MTEDELIFVSKNYVKLKEVQEKLATLDVNVISKNYRFFEQLENDLFCITVDKAISAYNDILKQFIQKNHYENKNVKSNIKNALYRINTNKAKSNFKTYLNLQFDTYYLSPCNFINIIALKYNDFLNY